MELTKTIKIAHRHDGYWLWDDTRQMNLAMRASSEQEAFVRALTYYQNRLTQVEAAHKKLKEQVDAFLGSMTLGVSIDDDGKVTDAWVDSLA